MHDKITADHGYIDAMRILRDELQSLANGLMRDCNPPAAYAAIELATYANREIKKLEGKTK